MNRAGVRADGGVTRPAQPTVMVTGGRDRLVRSVPRELLAERSRSGDAVVLVSAAGSPGAATAGLCSTVESLTPESVAVVTPDGPAGDVAASVVRVDAEPAPADLSGAVETAFRSVTAQGRTHLLVEGFPWSVGPDGSAPGPDAGDPIGSESEFYGRARTLAMTAGERPGLALFAVAAGNVPADELDALAHLFDVHVRLREGNGEPQARWTALTARSDGWRPWDKVELPRGGPV